VKGEREAERERERGREGHGGTSMGGDKGEAERQNEKAGRTNTMTQRKNRLKKDEVNGAIFLCYYFL
jgi:hypothetical protein